MKIDTYYRLETALDIVDYLLDAPCADKAIREQFWQSIQIFLISHWQRLDNHKKLIAIQYAEEIIGSSEQFTSITDNEKNTLNEQESYEIITDFKGKKLAIFTLIEGAALRAKIILEKAYPGLEVFLNHDKVATPKLTNLAKISDYVVFAARSSAHQAFYPIQKRRDDIIYPDGKGSSSIVTAFTKRLENS